MGEWNSYRLNDFEWEVLQAYIKYGYGEAKLYNTTFFSCNMTDETVCLTLNQFAEKAVDWEDELWANKIKTEQRVHKNSLYILYNSIE